MVISMGNLNRLFYSLVLVTGLVTAQLAHADSHSSPDNQITPSMLTLSSDEGMCTVSGSSNQQSQRITLRLNAPCYWVTAADNTTEEPLSYSYPEKKIDAIMLVAGGELDWSDEKKTYNKLPLNAACSQYLQGVIISENEIYAVDGLMEAPHCKGLTVDEKAFQQATESEIRYKTTLPSPSSENSTGEEAKNQKTVDTSSTATETKIEPEENDSFLGSIQKTIKKLFTSDD